MHRANFYNRKKPSHATGTIGLTIVQNIKHIEYGHVYGQNAQKQQKEAIHATPITYTEGRLTWCDVKAGEKAARMCTWACAREMHAKRSGFPFLNFKTLEDACLLDATGNKQKNLQVSRINLTISWTFGPEPISGSLFLSGCCNAPLSARPGFLFFKALQVFCVVCEWHHHEVWGEAAEGAVAS